MGPARAGLLHNALGSLAVLGVVALIALGLPLLDRSLPASRPVAGDVPYSVGGAVTVVPPDGASLDVAQTRPGHNRGTALFVVDGVRVAIVVGPFDGTLDEAATRLKGKITRGAGGDVAAPDQAVHTAQGVSGLRGWYSASSAGRAGEYAVFVADRTSVEITASGPEDRRRLSIDATLRTITFGTPR